MVWTIKPGLATKMAGGGGVGVPRGLPQNRPVGGDIKFEVDLNDEQRTKLKRFFMLSDDQIDVALYYTRRGKKIPDPAAYTIAKRCDSMILYLLIALLIFVAYAEYSINVLDEAERFLPSEVGVVRQALAKASQLVGYFWG